MTGCCGAARSTAGVTARWTRLIGATSVVCVWSRTLDTPGRQQGTSHVYDGVMYMPNPNDNIQAIDAVTGDLMWEYRRSLPEDVCERLMPGVCSTNRNLAIYDNLIIDASVDEYVFALDARAGDLVWETQVLDYRVHPANQSTGPIIANGKVISGRSCMPGAGPERPALSRLMIREPEKSSGVGGQSRSQASPVTRHGEAFPTKSADTSGPGCPESIASERDESPTGCAADRDGAVGRAKLSG